MPSNTPANRYGSIAAEIYDIDKPLGAVPDTAFHLERLAGLTGAILEPACGSGRTLVPLLEAGHEVVGFDPSSEMLARCRERCAERGFVPDLTLQRFEDFTYDRTFAAILVPVGSFTLIDNFAVALSVLGRFRDHLAPGGLLILDLGPIRALSASGEDRRSWTSENGDLLTLEGQRSKTHVLAQPVEYAIRYERWRDNALIESQLEPMVQRYWGLEEARMAMAASGFAQIAVCGGSDRSRPPRASDRTLTFEAVRT